MPAPRDYSRVDFYTGKETAAWRALQRVSFVDSMDPTKKLKAMFNPQELPTSVSAVVGELNPIGWSQPVQQYAYTSALGTSLTLPFSELAMQELKIPYPDVQTAARFFKSFLYGARPGIAPRFLMLIWPKTALLVCTVRKVDVNFSRWDANMNVREYTVVLDLVEIREQFLSSWEVGISGGFTSPDPAVRSEAVFKARTGRALKASSSGEIGPAPVPISGGIPGFTGRK